MNVNKQAPQLMRAAAVLDGRQACRLEDLHVLRYMMEQHTTMCDSYDRLMPYDTRYMTTFRVPCDVHRKIGGIIDAVIDQINAERGGGSRCAEGGVVGAWQEAGALLDGRRARPR